MSFDMPSIPRIEFIGRQREIADHQRFLAQETPWLFLIAGMPGIGKSTLLNYFEDHAPRETLYIKLDFANQLLTTDPLKILEELSWRLANYCDEQAVDTFDQELQAARSHFVQHGLQLVTNIRERILASKAVKRSKNLQKELEMHIEYSQEDAIVEEQEQLRKVEEAFYVQIRTCTAKSLVLLFDTCEWLNRSEVREQGEWFTDKLIPQLHQNLRCHIIIASRTYPKMKTITSQEQILDQLPMLDKSSVLTYLQDIIGIEDEKARTEIFTITHGHPLCLSIMIALWREKGEAGDVADSPLETEYNERTIVELVRERLDSHLKSPFREWTHYGVLFRLFNWEFLRAIFPELETVANLYTCFEIFTTYSYIKDIGGGYYTIHELFREVLAENVRTQEYDTWKHYHQQALNYYANRADSEQYYHAFALDDRKGMIRWHERVQEAFYANNDRAEIEQLLDNPKDSAFRLSAFGEGLYHYTWGLYESSRKQWSEASEQFRWSLEKFQEANEPTYEALAHRSLGDIAAKDPDPDVRQQALASYEQASNIFSDLTDIMNEALVLQATGDVQQSNNQQQEALHSYKEALALFRQINKDTARKYEASVLQTIGTLKLLNKEQWLEALNDYRQSQRIFHDLHDRRGEAFILLAIGNFRLLGQKTVYEQLKDFLHPFIAGGRPAWQEAIEDYQRALSLFDAINNQQNAIDAILSIGDTYRQNKQWSKALEQYETAIERYRQLDINTRNMLLADEALIYEKIGEVQEKLHERQMAQESYQQSLALFAQAKDSNNEGRVLQLINNTQASAWWRMRSFLRRPRYSIFVVVVLVILIVVAPIVPVSLLPLVRAVEEAICNQNQSPPNTIGITQTSPLCGTQSIGVSDGSYTFDIGLGNISDKNLAAGQKRAGNITKAEQLWLQAHEDAPADAEAAIYAEDLSVISSHQKYITIVVGAPLTPYNNIFRSEGRDLLQGAYIAQEVYNEKCRIANQSCPLLRLLVANVGDNPNYATFVARQIVNIVRKDPTIIGVTGFMTSTSTLNAIVPLADAHIPLISSTATSDKLTGKSPYFFRTVPADDIQAAFGAFYAKRVRHRKRVAVFYDPQDAYSNSLASAFRLNFDPTGKQIIASEQYTVGARDEGPLINDVNNVITMHPDLIYFAGYANDASVLLTNTNIQNGSTLLMGGDGFFAEADYTIAALNTTFQYLYFTSFALINMQDASPSQKAFQQSYQAQFDPGNSHPRTYGYSQPDSNVILTNDTINVFIKGYQNALLDTKGSSITPNEVRIGLSQIDSTHPFSGVGGQIAFDRYGNPINKTVVMLHGDTINDLRIVARNTQS